jgi:large subunit ribosomal protein L14
MIQQQSYLDIADNTGAKQAMCIKVLGGSSSKGKFKRRIAHVGDVIICAVKKIAPGGEIKQGEIIRCVVVRTRQPTIRKDGSYVRFDRNAAVVIDKENNPRGTRIFGAVARELRDQEFHEDRLARERSGLRLWRAGPSSARNEHGTTH